MSDIYLQEGTLLSVCAGMRTLCNQEEERLTQIDHLVNNLGTHWQGVAEREYLARFLLVKREYKNIIEELRRYEKLLRITVKEYMEIEEKYVSRIEAI